MKFGFIAKHRGIWPAEWLCGALGVSRGGFYAWLTRPRSRRSRSDEELSAKVRASFLASDRTYGARRVWHDMLAEGISCGLHRIERLMRLQALRARPRRRRLPPDLGERPIAAVAANVLNRSFDAPAGIGSGPQIGIQKGPPGFALRTISARAVGAGRGCGDGASAGCRVIVGSALEAPAVVSGFNDIAVVGHTIERRG